MMKYWSLNFISLNKQNMFVTGTRLKFLFSKYANKEKIYDILNRD